MAWTERDYEKVRKRWVRGAVDARHSTVTSGSSRDAAIHKTTSRRGESAPSPYRSKLEAAWAQKLEMEKRAGEIVEFYYEPANLRLPGGRNYYKPDFLVHHGSIGNDGVHVRLTFYEIKGRNPSDDRSLVKLKTAAGLNPWARFILVKRVNGQWEEREIQ